MRVKRPPAVAGRRRRYKHLFLGDYVGQLIDAACARLGLSQAQLGEEIGVNTTKLAEYRNGRTHPSEQVRRRLVAGLGADLTELIARELADKIVYTAESMRATDRQKDRALELLSERR